MSKGMIHSMSHGMGNSMSNRVGNSMCKRSCNSMSNRVGNSMCKRSSNSMSNRVGNSMGYWVSDSMRQNWGSMGYNRAMSNSLRVGSSSFIGNLRNETIIVIGMVVHMLDTSIRKVDRVGSLNNTSAIIGLSLVESCSRVVISNSIVVAVRRHLSKVRSSISSSNRVSNGMGSMNNRGMSKGRGSMNNRGMGDERGSMDSMGNRVTNHTSSSMESVRSIRH